MTRFLRRARFVPFVLVAMLVIGSQNAAPGDPVVAQEPMFVQTSVKPAFIMAVDDSGSMDGEGSYITNDGALWWNTARKSFIGSDREDNPSPGTLNFNKAGGANATWKKYIYLFPFGSGGQDTDLRVYGDDANDHFAVPPVRDFAYSRAPEYNAAYFNPSIPYTPWRNADGTSYPSYDTDAEFGAVPADPNRGATRLNLKADFAYTGANQTFRMYEGMRIQGGAGYYVRARAPAGACPSTAGFANEGVWANAPAAGLTVQNSDNGNAQEYCDIAFSYYPATFYLKATTPLPTGYGYTGPTIAGATGPDGAALIGYEIKPGNFASGAYNAAMTNFANWFAYYRKRHLATRAGITEAFVDTSGLRVGYFEINDRVDATMRDLDDEDDKAAFYNSVVNLRGSGGTPNREAVNHLGRQFQRTDANAPILKQCQANFGMLFTDGFSNASNPASPGNVDGGASPYFQSNVFRDTTSNTLADIVASFYITNPRPLLPTGQVPVSDTCDINDPRQDCNPNLHMNFYGITLGARGLEYGVNVPATTDPYTTKPTWPTAFSDRHPSAVDDLWHAAINGRGKFLNAKTPQGIAEAIDEVIEGVLADGVSSGSRGASGARISGGSNSFTIEPSFAANDADWTGDLVAWAIRRNGSLVSTPLWSAATKLDARAYSNRDIFFAKVPGMRGTGGLDSKRFNDTNVGATNYALLGLTASGALSKYGATGALMPNIVDYLRGSTLLEQDGTAGKTYRARSSVLGDIVNSAPLIASPKDNFGYYSRFDASGQSYSDYLTEKSARAPVVYVGANDGMLHAFDASTTTCPGQFPDPSACSVGTSGRELFAFIPNGVIGKMGRLLDPDYGEGGNRHTYFVDGEINVVDVKDGTDWETVLVGATGAGGRSVFALNVSNPTSFGENDVLWELNNTVAGFGDLGHTVGRPLILPLKDGATTVWAALFGNGYGGDSRKPSLYIVNAMTGALIRQITPNDGEAGVFNGLGEITAIDTDRDGRSDTVYGGDLRGNVWKFRLDGPNASWAVAFGGRPLFTATDTANNRQPITGGFRISAGPSGGVTVLFGTGSYVFESDRAAGTRLQSLYAVWDKSDADAAANAVATRTSSLVRQTVVSDNGTTRDISRNVVNYATKFGWYLDLAHPTAGAVGERFVGVPRIQNGKVFFATYTPQAADECGAGGKNLLYALDLLSGQGALGGITQLGSTGTACTGDCGAIALESGAQRNVAPVMNTSMLVPSSALIPGLTCVPGAPGCPATPGFQQCQVVIYPGAFVLRRPCDRQSWRQVR